MVKRKRFICCLASAALWCVVCFATLASCSADGVKSVSVSGPTEISVGAFEYSDYSVDVEYDSGKTTKIPLEKDMLSAEDNLKFFHSGEQTFTVNYGGKTCEFNVNVCLYEFTDLKFDDIKTVYTGNSVVAEVFDNYPEGTEIYYVNGNTFVNAGKYTVTAIVSGQNYVTKTLTATVEITKADYDMSAVTFTDKTFACDGKAHSIEVSGDLPSGVTVSYDGNKKINPGEYEVTARFSSANANYNEIADKTATMSINKKKHDLQSLVFEDAEVTYDGKEHTIEVQNCPNGVKVVYTVHKDSSPDPEEGTKFIDAGNYVFTAKFIDTDPNYETIEEKTATLKIVEADYDATDIVLSSKEVTYDGKSQAIAVPELPDGWTKVGEATGYKKDGKYIYEEEDGEEVLATEVTESGIYTFELALGYKNGNYKGFTLTATLIINKADYDLGDVTVGDVYYDNGKTVKINPTGLPDGVTTSVKYFNEKPNEQDNYIRDKYDVEKAADGVTDIGEYWYIMTFEGDTNYNELLPWVGQFRVVEKPTEAEESGTESGTESGEETKGESGS